MDEDRKSMEILSTIQLTDFYLERYDRSGKFAIITNGPALRIVVYWNKLSSGYVMMSIPKMHKMRTTLQLSKANGYKVLTALLLTQGLSYKSHDRFAEELSNLSNEMKRCYPGVLYPRKSTI